jgi:hypothetical protein
MGFILLLKRKGILVLMKFEDGLVQTRIDRNEDVKLNGLF